MKLTFLPVGHTHEDIDQMFSRFAYVLAHTNTESLEDLEHNLYMGYTPAPQVEEVPYTANFREWIADPVKKLHGHFKPHVFKFAVDLGGKVMVQCKAWSRRRTWMPEGGLNFISCDNLLQEMPAQQHLTEMKDLDIQAIFAGVVKVESMFKRESSMQEWRGWLEKQDKVLPEFGEVWDDFKGRFNGEAKEVVMDEADGSSESETECPIYLGRRPKRKPEDMEVRVVPGKMVAAWMQESETPFELGRVLRVETVREEERVFLQWYGTKKKDGTGKWHALQKSGTSEPYIQDVHMDSVLWGGFKLTAKGRCVKKADLEVIMSRLELAIAQQEAELAEKMRDGTTGQLR